MMATRTAARPTETLRQVAARLEAALDERQDVVRVLDHFDHGAALARSGERETVIARLEALRALHTRLLDELAVLLPPTGDPVFATP